MANPEKRTGSGHYVSITRLIKLIALATNFCNVILFEGREKFERIKYTTKR